MSNFKKELEKFTTSYIDRLARTADERGITATGDTIRDTRSEISTGGAKVIAPSHILTWEDGRGPTVSQGAGIVDQLQRWIDAKGLDLNVYAVKTKIHLQGTLLFNNSDPRFSKPTGVLNEGLQPIIDQLKKAVVGSMALDVRDIMKKLPKA